MPYKLMILENGVLLSAAALEAKLNEIGFTVPQIIPYEPEELPANQPVYPKKTLDYYTNPEVKAAWNAAYLLYKQENNAYQGVCAPIVEANKVSRQNFLNQFPEFADYLEFNFVMIKNIDGKYVQVNPILPNYTFLQAAQKLMGYACVRPLNAIDFICNKYFG